MWDRGLLIADGIVATYAGSFASLSLLFGGYLLCLVVALIVFAAIAAECIACGERFSSEFR
jgi:hypothetical protein